MSGLLLVIVNAAKLPALSLHYFTVRERARALLKDTVSKHCEKTNCLDFSYLHEGEEILIVDGQLWFLAHAYSWNVLAALRAESNDDI